MFGKGPAVGHRLTGSVRKHFVAHRSSSQEQLGIQGTVGRAQLASAAELHIKLGL